MVRERVIGLRRQRWPYHAIACKLGDLQEHGGEDIAGRGIEPLWRFTSR